MMPYGGPTPTTRTVGRSLRITSYLLAATVAFGDLVYPSAILEAVTWQGWDWVASAIFVLGVVGLYGCLLHKWRIEWTPAAALFFLLMGRALLTWAGVPEEPTRLSAAAMMTLGSLCLGARALDLYVFDYNTKQTAQLAGSTGSDS